jgi:trans-aconitate 2-methyltransferase
MRNIGEWDATAYARFGDERTRPLIDLLARVGSEDPALVADLGCGNGPATLVLAERWRRARLVGVDSSGSMLAAARELDAQARVEWLQADLREWDPASLEQSIDVIVSNATLQWIPNHLALLDRWVSSLADQGWLALQVPGNFDAPSHALMREVAATQPRADELLEAIEVPQVGEPATYVRYLSRLGCQVDAWETTYTHVLPVAVRHPVLTWVSSTGLRPLLALLTEENERASFLAAYEDRLAEAYPVTAEGVLFPFRRVFAVAQRSVSAGPA